MRIAVAALLLGLSAATAGAQTATDIYLLDLTRDGTGYRVTGVTRVTDRDGYDNQPAFTADGSALLYTSIAGQADIRSYDIATGAHSAVTHTDPESEYSATPYDGRFSAIRVEADSTQRLWSFALDGTDARVLLPDVAPVGYHAWIAADRLALFVLGSPSTLVIANVQTGATRTVASDIGRSLHRIPGGSSISYVQRSNGRGTIMAFDPATDAAQPLVAEVEDNEFHAWLPDGTLLSASAATLLRWRAGETGWTPVIDLSSHGIAGITRIASSPDGRRIAIVAAR